MNREEAINWLKGYQLHYLKKRFGEGYQTHLRVNDPMNFSIFVDKYIEENEELTEDEKIEIEVELKNEAFSSEVLHTEYESAWHHRILRYVADRYKSLNPDQNPSQSLYLGTILSNDINAEIISKPDIKATFILFDGELLLASLVLAKIIAHSLPLKKEPPHLFFPIENAALFENLVENKTNFDRMIMGLYCCIFYRPGNSPQYFNNNELHEYISSYLVESMELFVFSHEMGHYLNGDLIEDQNKPENSGNIKTTWLEEYWADLHGINQIINLYRTNGQIISLLGPEIFLNFLILREKLKPELEKITTHPPSSQRLYHYRLHLSNFLNEEEQLAFLPFQNLIDLLFQYYHDVLIKTIDGLKSFMNSQEYLDHLKEKKVTQ